MKLALLSVALLLVAMGWGKDFVSLEGERTIYTARCVDGEWRGMMCSGQIVPGDRYRFRALKNKHEVLFWTVGSSAPSDKYTDCTIRSRDTWLCATYRSQVEPPPFAMVEGHLRTASGSAIQPPHCLLKWKWWLLRFGVGAFHEADS